MTEGKPKMLVSFSGGETSAFMAQWLWKHKRDEYEMIFVFANTGQENEETLNFANKCAEHFGFPLVWVEADVQKERGKGTKHKVVTYETASRAGEPFEDVIEKYSIPNVKFPHCTRELKRNPINSYARSLGWKKRDFVTAIGIRIDEIDRINPNFREEMLIYPLVSMQQMTKKKINFFWSQMPFRLNLKGYEGNCKWCWKKSLRKHLTLISENPSFYDFPKKMEEKYADKPVKGKRTLRFFRNNLTVDELAELVKKGFEPAADDSRVYEQTEIDGNPLDISNGCVESCEVF